MLVSRLEIAKSVARYSLMILAKTEVLKLLKNPDQCLLQVNGTTLKQVEKFQYSILYV